METENQYGMEACYESVIFYIEFLKKNPFELLGRFHIRAKQDRCFNKTIILALEKYIEDHGIMWDAK